LKNKKRKKREERSNTKKVFLLWFIYNRIFHHENVCWFFYVHNCLDGMWGIWTNVWLIHIQENGQRIVAFITTTHYKRKVRKKVRINAVLWSDRKNRLTLLFYIIVHQLERSIELCLKNVFSLSNGSCFVTVTRHFLRRKFLQSVFPAENFHRLCLINQLTQRWYTSQTT
jgi:hypothetical protein